MLFHQQHFMTLLNCAKSYMEKNSCGKRKLRKISQLTSAYTFILTTIFFNRWCIVNLIKAKHLLSNPQTRTRAEEVMQLCINQIICTGQILYKRKPEEQVFYGEKETLLNNSFTFNKCKNIVFIFNNNINRLLKNCITKENNEKISTLINVKVSNIQYSRKLNFDKTTLVNTFLPLLQSTSTINQIFITQEPNVPSLTTLDTVFGLQTSHI